MFFHNHFNIWYFKTDQANYSNPFQEIALKVDRNEQNSRILKVKCGGSDDIIAITVQQTKQEDMMLFWNVERNAEIESFDTNK